MFFKIVDKFKVNVDELIVVEGETCDEGIEVLDKIAENWYFVFLANQVYRKRKQFFLYFVRLDALE